MRKASRSAALMRAQRTNGSRIAALLSAMLIVGLVAGLTTSALAGAGGPTATAAKKKCKKKKAASAKKKKCKKAVTPAPVPPAATRPCRSAPPPSVSRTLSTESKAIRDPSPSLTPAVRRAVSPPPRPPRRVPDPGRSSRLRGQREHLHGGVAPRRDLRGQRAVPAHQQRQPTALHGRASRDAAPGSDAQASLSGTAN